MPFGKNEEKPCPNCILKLLKVAFPYLKLVLIDKLLSIFIVSTFQVTHSFCKEFLQGLLTHLDQDGDLNVTELMRRLFEKGSKARMLSQAYHRYALNYINALNYLESLRRHNDFCDFEKVPTNAFLTAT